MIPSRSRTLPRRLPLLFIAALLLALLAAPGGARAQDASSAAPAAIELDADGDGLMDEQELQIGTDPNTFDTDMDGLGDGDELEVFKTDPLATDSDKDGVDDATELDAGSDPRDPKSLPIRDAQPDEDAKLAQAKPAAQVVKALPSTGTGSASDAIDGNGVMLLLVALSLASLAGLAGTSKLTERHGV